MASIKSFLVLGLILSTSLIAGNFFFVDTALNYGKTPTDISTINATADFRSDIETVNEQLLGKGSEVTIFGVFTSFLSAIGNILNLFLQVPNLFITMIGTFNSYIAGGSIMASYLITALEGIIFIGVIYVVLKAVLGGRV